MVCEIRVHDDEIIGCADPNAGTTYPSPEKHLSALAMLLIPEASEKLVGVDAKVGRANYDCVRFPTHSLIL